MFVFKRKQVVITIIFFMVLAAGYINWAYQPEQKSAAVAETEKQKYLGEAEMVAAPAKENVTDKVTKAKIDARNKAMELLKKIADNPSSGDQARNSALAQMTQMADNMEKETICEGILNSKGMGKFVVYIAEQYASVTVDTKSELTKDMVAKITDVILSNTSVKAENIKISKAE